MDSRRLIPFHLREPSIDFYRFNIPDCLSNQYHVNSNLPLGTGEEV